MAQSSVLLLLFLLVLLARAKLTVVNATLKFQIVGAVGPSNPDLNKLHREINEDETTGNGNATDPLIPALLSYATVAIIEVEFNEPIFVRPLEDFSSGGRQLGTSPTVNPLSSDHPAPKWKKGPSVWTTDADSMERKGIVGATTTPDTDFSQDADYLVKMGEKTISPREEDLYRAAIDAGSSLETAATASNLMNGDVPKITRNQQPPVPITNVNLTSAFYGNTRLICGSRLFDSHPSLVHENNPPLYLLPLMGNQAFDSPITALLGPWLPPLPANTYRLALLTAYAQVGKKSAKVLFEKSHFDECELRFLPVTSRSWSSHASQLVDGEGNGYHATVNISSSDGQVLSYPSHSDLARRSRTVISTVNTVLARAYPSPSMLETMENLRVTNKLGTKIAGLVKGIFGGVISPLGDAMGPPIAGPIVDPLLAPIGMILGPIVLGGAIDGLMTSLPDIINKLDYTIGFTILDATVETVSNGLSLYVTEQLTPRLVKKVVTKFDKEVLSDLVEGTSSDGAGAMARLIIKGMASIMPRSVSHSLVPALIETMAVSPFMDYYCYYCKTHGVYCDYCKEHESPNQLYYAEYYTSYFSGYYSMYYADFYSTNLLAKIVREKKQDPNIDAVSGKKSEDAQESDSEAK